MKIIGNKRASRGFTLIELVIVIAVIAILAALLVPTILGQAERARKSRAAGDAASIAKSIARLRTDTGLTISSCLTNLSNLATPTSASLSAQCSTTALSATSLQLCASATPGYVCYGGPYMTAVNNDPWNDPYSVTVNTSTYAITVLSAGPDLSFNTSDDITYVQ